MPQFRNILPRILEVFIISVLMSPVILSSSEHRSYEHVENLIYRYSYAMDPDQQEDKLLITDLPKLYSDALETHAAEQSGAVDSKIACTLLTGVFKNYANIIKDKLANSKLPYISKKYVSSTANWSTGLLEITMEKGLYNFTGARVCDDNTKSPLELACVLMLHKPMLMLISQGIHDTEELYNCLLLCTVNSDVEGFDIIWHHLCLIYQCSNGCQVARKPITGTIVSKALRNIQLSIFNVAHFHCKKSHLCIMIDYLCKTLCHDLCSRQFADVISTFLSYRVELSSKVHEQQLNCPYGYTYIINGYHGWRTGFTTETGKCQIPSVNIRQLNKEILELFADIKQPLVIKGVDQDWTLLAKWTRRHLQKHFKSIEVLGGSIPYGEVFGEPFGSVRIEEYLLYMDTLNDELPADYYSIPMRDQEKAVLPFYVFDSEVLHHYFMMDYAIPDVFKVWNATEHHQFILGPPGSGAPFHFHCHAVNFLTYGRKKWLLTPPGISVYSKLHPLKLYSNQYIDILSHLKPLECMQNAGDMLYVPSGWGHATINIDESIGFAVEFELLNC